VAENKMSNDIKIGICVAYDWAMLQQMLPFVYDNADRICLSIDQERISWSGNTYPWNEDAFRDLIRTIDIKSKIDIIEDNYHFSDLTPMENEVRQRNQMAAYLGNDGWHIQLDCDEYFLDFGKFVNFLRSLTVQEVLRANVCCSWLHLYKRLPDGFLVVIPNKVAEMEFIQIASRNPHYEYGRRNGDFNIHTNFVILHRSWARSEIEIETKIYNWGHSRDFDQQEYLLKWKVLNRLNYTTYKNFHPVKPHTWRNLAFVPATSVSALADGIAELDLPKYTEIGLWFRNSRFFSKVRAFIYLFIPTSEDN
jgi:hypothetical protein